MSYVSKRVYNDIIGATSSNNILISPIDLRSYDKFTVTYQNNNTAISFLNLRVEVAQDSSENVGATAAPNWVTINTTTLVQPSALGPSATIMSTPVENAYAWLRVRANLSTTISINTVSVHIAGHTRYKG